MSGSPSFSMKLESNKKLDLEALHQWVVAFCIIKFDLEQGQLVEECYPPCSLTRDEELGVAFSSFPDSVSQHHNLSSIHDSIFFFRMRRNSQEGHTSSSEVAVVDANNTSITSDNKTVLKISETSRTGEDSEYLYGYVFNRQRHDEKLRRGGEQKSVVILSYFPYSSVFRPLLQIIGPLYFDIGKEALEHIASCISKWPAPVPGKLMELPIANVALKVNLPPAHCLPSVGRFSFEESASSMAPFPPTNPSVPHGLFHDSDLFGIFRGLLLQLWLLWELLLIGEPILIIAPTPPQCCEAVASLVSLVAPLFCSVDFRPYFTIHDPEFSVLNSLQEGASMPPVVLGVTNLYFLKALRNVPHVVSVGVPSSSFNRPSVSSRSDGKTLGSSNGPLSLKKLSPTNLFNTVKLRRDGPLSLMTEHKEYVWSTYAAVTKPDIAILNRLIDAGMSPRVEESMSVVNNEILRRHFLELTTNFLAPFAPYFKATTLSEGSSPFVDPPSLPVFNIEEFLENIAVRGPGKFISKRMKSNWLDLYRRFMQGHNFVTWFQRRRTVAEQEQQKLWGQARMKIDIHQFISKLSELEIIDSFNAIERHLLSGLQLQQQSGKGSVVDSATACKKLRSDLQAVFDVLPMDVQQLLLLNPQRASLLHLSPTE